MRSGSSADDLRQYGMPYMVKRIVRTSTYMRQHELPVLIAHHRELRRLADINAVSALVSAALLARLRSH